MGHPSITGVYLTENAMQLDYIYRTIYGIIKIHLVGYLHMNVLHIRSFVIWSQWFSQYTTGAGHVFYKDRVSVEVAGWTFVDIVSHDYLLGNTYRPHTHTVAYTLAYLHKCRQRSAFIQKKLYLFSNFPRRKVGNEHEEGEDEVVNVNAWSTKMKFPAGKPPFLYNVPRAGDYKYFGTYHNNILCALLDGVYE